MDTKGDKATKKEENAREGNEIKENEKEGESYCLSVCVVFGYLSVTYFTMMPQSCRTWVL